MSDTPQLEDGYTRIANELLEALLRAGLSSRQWAVVMAVVRKTYGFSKKSDDIGLSQLVEMTGIDKGNLSRTVRELESMKVLTREVGTYAHKLGVNKRYSQWELSNQQQLPNQQRLSKQQLGVVETTTLGVVDSTKEGLPDRQPQKKGFKESEKKTPKETIHRSLRDRFDEFWQAYPRKEGKQSALKAFEKVKPDDQLLDQMLGAIEIAKKTEQWQHRRLIKHPATWLSAGCWDDELQVEYDGQQIEVIEFYNETLGAKLGDVDKAVFSEGRAGAISDFVTFLPPEQGKECFWRRYFKWVRDTNELPPHCGFDYLIGRDGYTKTKSGQHTRSAA